MLIKEQNTERKSLTALNLNKVIALISINLSIHIVKTAVFIYISFVAITYLNINVSRHSWKIKSLFFFPFHLYICFMV